MVYSMLALEYIINVPPVEIWNGRMTDSSPVLHTVLPQINGNQTSDNFG
jgi:hypothetical protein